VYSGVNPRSLAGDWTLTTTVNVLENLWRRWHRQYSLDVVGAREIAVDSTGVDSVYPSFARVETAHCGIRRILDETACTFVVPLFLDGERNIQLPWQRAGRRSEFKYVEYGVYERALHMGDDRCVSRPFEVGLRAVLHPPPRPALPPEHEFDTPLPSAGLPGLSERKRT
jgi:hypothetical protein